MREFPSVAVMENRMLTAENEMDCFLNSPIQTGGHSNLSNVFDCVPVPVIFVVAIFLLSRPLFCELFLVTNKGYFVLTATSESRSVKT